MILTMTEAHSIAVWEYSGIFDRAYTVDFEPIDDNGPTLNTTRPVLGVTRLLDKHPERAFSLCPETGSGAVSSASR